MGKHSQTTKKNSAQKAPKLWGLRIAWILWILGVLSFGGYVVLVELDQPMHRAPQVSVVGAPQAAVQHVYGFKEFQHKAGNKSEGLPSLYLVVTELGLDDRLMTEVMTSFPKTTTLGLWPYAKKLKPFMETAWKAGHELLMVLPFQPIDGMDLGPLMIHPDHPLEKNQEKLKEILEAGENYMGVIASSRNQIVSSHATLEGLLKTIEDEKLAFVDASLSARSVATSVLEKSHEPHVTVHFLLDKEMDQHAVNQELKQLTKRLKEKSSAVVVVEATPITIYTVSSWLQRHGGLFQVLPLSGAFQQV